MFMPLLNMNYMKRMNEYWDGLLKNAIPWDEDKTKFDTHLCLQGESYNSERYRLFDSPPLDGRPQDDSDELVWSPSKKWAYANRLLKSKQRLDLAQGNKTGKVAFDKDVVVPVLFEHRPDSWMKFRVWMGVTPMEVLTQRQGIRLSKGHVIMGGLGLGWMLRKVAEKKSVKKITLIEISDEILDWYGRDLCEQIQEETGTEIEVVCDDVLGHIGKYGDDARYILDIWPDYPTPFDHLKKEWRDALRSVEGQWWGWGVFRGDHW